VDGVAKEGGFRMVKKWLVVKSFWCMGLDFFMAETALPPEGEFGLVRYYLLCHSLELSFKAFLSDKGKNIKELSKREFGHNLEMLLVECEANGLAQPFLDPTILQQQVKVLNKYYSDKQFEYGEIADYELPNLTHLRGAVSALITATKGLWMEPERAEAEKP
jgi:hypothetical protein